MVEEKEATPTAEGRPVTEVPRSPKPDFGSERRRGPMAVGSTPHLARHRGGVGGAP